MCCCNLEQWIQASPDNASSEFSLAIETIPGVVRSHRQQLFVYRECSELKNNYNVDGAVHLSPWMDTLLLYVQSDYPDLTNRQLALMMSIYLEPGPHTVRGLAARLGVSKPVITRALNTLSALGLLRRKKDEKDLRNVLVEYTPSGATFLKSLAKMKAKVNKSSA